jgi:hypothetical protein
MTKRILGLNSPTRWMVAALAVSAPAVADAELCRDGAKRIIRCPASNDPVSRCVDARGFVVRCGLPGSTILPAGTTRVIASKMSRAGREEAADPDEQGFKGGRSVALSRSARANADAATISRPANRSSSAAASPYGTGPQGPAAATAVYGTPVGGRGSTAANNPYRRR